MLRSTTEKTYLTSSDMLAIENTLRCAGFTAQSEDREFYARYLIGLIETGEVNASGLMAALQRKVGHKSSYPVWRGLRPMHRYAIQGLPRSGDRA